MVIASKFLKKPVIIVFSIISLAYLFLTFLLNHFIYTDNLYATVLSVELTNERIHDILDQQRRIQWIAYIAIPLVILFKVFFFTICIFIYSLLSSIQLKWKQIFKIVLETEAIVLIPLVLKLIWFSSFPPDSLQEVSDFAPWSLIVFATEDTPVYLKYVLQTINVFELLYWILLATGIRSATQFPFSKSLGIVAKSYGVGLALWVVFVTFLLVQLS